LIAHLLRRLEKGLRHWMSYVSGVNLCVEQEDSSLVRYKQRGYFMMLKHPLYHPKCTPILDTK
jgi:hypothetical protein